jgi:O-antigen ligase/Tfp pilus assembly protein PilF
MLMEQKKINISTHQDYFYINAVEITIIALVVLVPITFYRHCITLFIPPKEAMTAVLVLLACMFWILKMIDWSEIKFASTPLNFPILSFIILCLLSLIWSDNFFVSFKELPLFLAGPLLYVIVINNINNQRQINRILTITLTVAGLFGIYGILQYNGIDFPFWIRNVGRQQVFGLFGNVNFFAEYLIIPLPIAISLFFTSRNKLIKVLLLISILTMGTSLILTFTRGSYLSLGISLIFMAFLFLTYRGKNIIKENKKYFLIVLLIIIIVASLFFIPNPFNKPETVVYKIKSRISISAITESDSIRSRITNWKYTILMIKDHFFLGSGIGTYKYNSLKYQAEFFDQGDNRSLYPYVFMTKTHNEYLQLWAELGIVGLGIFLWLLVTYFIYGFKLLKRINNNYNQGLVIGLMGAVVAVLVDGIFGFPFHLPATIVLFWLSLALTVSIIKSETGLEKNYFTKKDENKKIKEEKENISSFVKLLLSVVVILGIIFLCVTVARPFIARTYWYYGNKELKSKNVNEAIKIYEKALEWDPYLGEIYYELGRVLQSRGIYNLALENLEKAEKYVDHPDLPQDLASIYIRKNLLDKAAIKLKQAISYEKNEKSMLPLYNQLGSIYFRQKNYKQAEMAFKNALEIDSNFVNSHYGLASVYLKKNKSEEALQELQKVIELAPDSQMAKNARELIQKIAREKLKAPPTETDNP